MLLTFSSRNLWNCGYTLTSCSDPQFYRGAHRLNCVDDQRVSSAACFLTAVASCKDELVTQRFPNLITYLFPRKQMARNSRPNRLSAQKVGFCDRKLLCRQLLLDREFLCHLFPGNRIRIDEGLGNVSDKLIFFAKINCC